MRVLVIVFMLALFSCGSGSSLNDDPLSGECTRPIPPAKVTYLERCFNCHSSVPAAYK